MQNTLFYFLPLNDSFQKSVASVPGPQTHPLNLKSLDALGLYIIYRYIFRQRTDAHKIKKLKVTKEKKFFRIMSFLEPVMNFGILNSTYNNFVCVCVYMGMC